MLAEIDPDYALSEGERARRLTAARKSHFAGLRTKKLKTDRLAAEHRAARAERAGNGDVGDAA